MCHFTLSPPYIQAIGTRRTKSDMGKLFAKKRGDRVVKFARSRRLRRPGHHDVNDFMPYPVAYVPPVEIENEEAAMHLALDAIESGEVDETDLVEALEKAERIELARTKSALFKQSSRESRLLRASALKQEFSNTYVAESDMHLAYDRATMYDAAHKAARLAKVTDAKARFLFNRWDHMDKSDLADEEYRVARDHKMFQHFLKWKRVKKNALQSQNLKESLREMAAQQKRDRPYIRARTERDDNAEIKRRRKDNREKMRTEKNPKPKKAYMSPAMTREQRDDMLDEQDMEYAEWRIRQDELEKIDEDKYNQE